MSLPLSFIAERYHVVQMPFPFDVNDMTKFYFCNINMYLTSYAYRSPCHIVGGKGRYLTQSYDKSPYTHRKIKKNATTRKTSSKTLVLTFNLTFYLIVWGFHRTFQTGAACQQRTLTTPDTWSCPTLGLACVLMSRPISPELVLFPEISVSNFSRYFCFASITQRLRADLGRSVGVTAVSPLVTLNRLPSAQPSH